MICPFPNETLSCHLVMIMISVWLFIAKQNINRFAPHDSFSHFTSVYLFFCVSGWSFDSHGFYSFSSSNLHRRDRITSRNSFFHLVSEVRYVVPQRLHNMMLLNGADSSASTHCRLPPSQRLGLKRVGEERKGEEDVRTSSNCLQFRPSGHGGRHW